MKLRLICFHFIGLKARDILFTVNIIYIYLHRDETHVPLSAGEGSISCISYQIYNLAPLFPADLLKSKCVLNIFLLQNSKYSKFFCICI